MQHLRNVPYKLYVDFLKNQGCKLTRTKASHEHYTRHDLLRQITVQSNVSPVPEFIILNGLRTLGLTKNDFFKWVAGDVKLNEEEIEIEDVKEFDKK